MDGFPVLHGIQENRHKHSYAAIKKNPWNFPRVEDRWFPKSMHAVMHAGNHEILDNSDENFDFTQDGTINYSDRIDREPIIDNNGRIIWKTADPYSQAFNAPSTYSTPIRDTDRPSSNSNIITQQQPLTMNNDKKQETLLSLEMTTETIETEASELLPIEETRLNDVTFSLDESSEPTIPDTQLSPLPINREETSRDNEQDSIHRRLLEFRLRSASTAQPKRSIVDKTLGIVPEGDSLSTEQGVNKSEGMLMTETSEPIEVATLEPDINSQSEEFERSEQNVAVTWEPEINSVLELEETPFVKHASEDTQQSQTHATTLVEHNSEELSQNQPDTTPVDQDITALELETNWDDSKAYVTMDTINPNLISVEVPEETPVIEAERVAPSKQGIMVPQSNVDLQTLEVEVEDRISDDAQLLLPTELELVEPKEDDSSSTLEFANPNAGPTIEATEQEENDNYDNAGDDTTLRSDAAFDTYQEMDQSSVKQANAPKADMLEGLLGTITKKAREENVTLGLQRTDSAPPLPPPPVVGADKSVKVALMRSNDSLTQSSSFLDDSSEAISLSNRELDSDVSKVQTLKSNILAKIRTKKDAILRLVREKPKLVVAATAIVVLLFPRLFGAILRSSTR